MSKDREELKKYMLVNKHKKKDRSTKKDTFFKISNEGVLKVINSTLILHQLFTNCEYVHNVSKCTANAFSLDEGRLLPHSIIKNIKHWK